MNGSDGKAEVGGKAAVELIGGMGLPAVEVEQQARSSDRSEGQLPGKFQ